MAYAAKVRLGRLRCSQVLFEQTDLRPRKSQVGSRGSDSVHSRVCVCHMPRRGTGRLGPIGAVNILGFTRGMERPFVSTVPRAERVRLRTFQTRRTVSSKQKAVRRFREERRGR